MISSKKELRFFIAADRIMAGKSAEKKWKEHLIQIIYPDHILNYLRSMRYVAYYLNGRRKGLHIISYLYHKWNFQRLGAKLGFSIGVNVFGYGLLIPHYGTIVVNNKTRAGKYCVLHTSTCIGGADKTIGDGLYLSSGAFIMGSKIILGDNVSIASNSVVTKSYQESNILLVGTPAVLKNTSMPWYERDGSEFKNRVAMVEQLKIKIGVIMPVNRAHERQKKTQ
jgi:serine O-acetyltransferase